MWARRKNAATHVYTNVASALLHRYRFDRQPNQLLVQPNQLIVHSLPCKDRSLNRKQLQQKQAPDSFFLTASSARLRPVVPAAPMRTVYVHFLYSMSANQTTSLPAHCAVSGAAGQLFNAKSAAFRPYRTVVCVQGTYGQHLLMDC